MTTLRRWIRTGRLRILQDANIQRNDDQNFLNPDELENLIAQPVNIEEQFMQGNCDMPQQFLNMMEHPVDVQVWKLVQEKRKNKNQFSVMIIEIL